MIQMNLFAKQTHRLRKQTRGYQRGKGTGINWEFGTNRHTLLLMGLPWWCLWQRTCLPVQET